MSWPLVKVGDVFEVSSSKRVLQKDWRKEGVPFYRAREVVLLSKNGEVDNDLFIDESMYENFKDKYGVPQEGDLLITAVGTLGQTYAVKKGDRFYFKDASVIMFRPKISVDLSYIQHAIRSPQVQRFIQNSDGATVGTYTISRAKETEIPLPPLAEQKRIAAILDKADAIRQKRKQAIEMADEFLRSVFLDMFGDPVTNPKGWEIKHLSDFAKISTGNTPPRKDPLNYGDHIEWIKSDNINTPLHFLTKASESLSEVGKFKGRVAGPGAVLMTCIAGSLSCIGNIAIADRKVAFNQQINAVEPTANSITEFLYGLMLVSKKTIQDSSTNSMKGMISKGVLSSLQFPCPSIEKQKDFKVFFRSYLTLINRLKEQDELSAEMFNALSQKAFAGEL